MTYPVANEDELAEAHARMLTRHSLPTVAAFTDVADEIARARRRFGPFASGHEGYAVLLEELDELWTEVKDNKRPDAERKPAMRKEAVQVAAMAICFMIECCEET